MIFLLLKAPQLERSALDNLQIGCMQAWIVAEALLNFILKVDFRNVVWMLISCIAFFFAGTGGQLGVAAKAGRGWSIPAITLLLILAILTFIQRPITGMKFICQNRLQVSQSVDTG
jgi:hypothetical protein